MLASCCRAHLSSSRTQRAPSSVHAQSPGANKGEKHGKHSENPRADHQDSLGALDFERPAPGAARVADHVGQRQRLYGLRGTIDPAKPPWGWLEVPSGDALFVYNTAMGNAGTPVTANHRDRPMGSSDLLMRCCAGGPLKGADVTSFSPKNSTDDAPVLSTVSLPSTWSPTTKELMWIGPQLKPSVVRSAESDRTRGPGTSIVRNAPI